MDLSKLDTRPKAETGTDLILKHPGTGEPLDIAITLLGKDSKKYRVADYAAKNKSMKTMRTGQADAGLSIEMEDAIIDVLAAVTIGWKNLQENGVDLEFSEGTARKIYTDYRWIADQVVAHVENRNNFLPNA